MSKPHVAGYVIRSASSGLQEASIAARVPLTNPSGNMEGGKVIAPPGEFRIYGRLSLRTINQTIDFSGSVFECWLDDSCIFVGDPRNSNLVSNVTLINPRGRPTVLHGKKPMIEVNGQKTRIFNLMTRSGVNLGQNQAGTFGSYLQVDDDQAFLLDCVDTTAGWSLECTPSFCGTLINAPGPFNRNSAVGWIKNAQISMQCMGNGVNWDSGNTLRISDSVVQGYSQFGVRAGVARGGYGNLSMDNVYMEDSGACPNPTGNIGTAGVLVRGGAFSFQGGEGPSGHFPAFAKDGEKAKAYIYYVVINHPKWGHSNPLLFGYIQKKELKEISRSLGPTAKPSSAEYPSSMFFESRSTWEHPAAGPTWKGCLCDCHWRGPTGRLRQRNLHDFGFSKTGCTVSGCSAGLLPQTGLLARYRRAVSLSGDTNSVTAPASASRHVGVWHSRRPRSSWDRRDSGLLPRRHRMDSSLGYLHCCHAANDILRPGFVLMANKPNDGGLLTDLKGRINLLTSGSTPGHLITLDSDVQKTVATRKQSPI